MQVKSVGGREGADAGSLSKLAKIDDDHVFWRLSLSIVRSIMPNQPLQMDWILSFGL